MGNELDYNTLLEENRRLFETSGKLLIEKNELEKRIEYLEREIKENNARIFKKKISL